MAEAPSAEVPAGSTHFLRSGNGVADRLADYLHTTRRDRPQLQDRPGYDANLVIDLVSFAAHALRIHRQGPPP